MRRNDREIKDLDSIASVMEKCDVCRLAFNDGDYPYIVPMNFGYAHEGDGFELYFHSAAAGKKFELIQSEGRAGFQMDCSHRLIYSRKACACSMEYESVIGAGDISIIRDEGEKAFALFMIMRHYSHGDHFHMSGQLIEKTAVFKLVVRSISGKRNIREVQECKC